MARNLALALWQFVKIDKLGEVLFAPLDVYLCDTEVYQPDIIFLATGNLHKIAPQRIEGAPDMVVEILSPSSSHYDLGHKKNVYEAYGVKNYWIVDPALREVRLFYHCDGKFEPGSIARAVDSLTAASLPGFSIEVNDIF